MPPPSDRWRLYITGTFAPGNCSIGEVEMATAAAGANLCTGGTASASTTYAPDPVTYAASKAFDGNLGTRWNNSGSESPTWLEYQFAAPLTIIEYRIKAPSSVYKDGMPSAWQLQYWDGGAWVVTDTQTGQPAWAFSESRAYGTYTAASIRTTQLVTDVLTQPIPAARATQVVADVLTKPPNSARLTQLVIDVLTKNRLEKIKNTPPSRGNSTVTTVTFDPKPALDSGVIILVHGYDAAAGAVFSPGACTDSFGNTYILAITQQNVVEKNAVGIYYCPRILFTGTPFNISIAFSSTTFFTTVGAEVAGPIALDQVASNTGSTTAATTGTTPPLTVNNAIVAAIQSITGGNEASIVVQSVSPPWFQEFEDLTWGSHIVGEADSRVISNGLGVGQSCAWTNATARPYAAAIATFRIPATAAAERVQFLILMG